MRNKRCILAYLSHRLGKIRELWWEMGSGLAEELKLNMSVHERDFFAGYDRVMTDFSKCYPGIAS